MASIPTEPLPTQLRDIADDGDFPGRSAVLVESWIAAGVGVDAVEPVLRFMEDNPAIDFGTPGALVHFVERFQHKGYEEKLLQSVGRKPTPHTAWMLKRLINGTDSPSSKAAFALALQHADAVLARQQRR